MFQVELLLISFGYLMIIIVVVVVYNQVKRDCLNLPAGRFDCQWQGLLCRVIKGMNS